MLQHTDLRLPPLSFLALAGFHNGNPGRYRLPTWLPNFPVVGREDARYFIGDLYYLHNPVTRSFLHRIGHNGDLSISNQSLHTTSLTIDTLKELSDAFTGCSDGHKVSIIEAMCKMMRRVFEASEQSSFAADHPLLKLTGAFCRIKVNWQSPEVLRVARRFLVNALEVVGEERSKSSWKGFHH